jgi:hypothetical protein
VALRHRLPVFPFPLEGRDSLNNAPGFECVSGRTSP